MDIMLCDELLQEIFTRLPSSSSSSVSLVSKRWLHLYRASRSSLSLQLTNENSTVACLSSLLSHCPYLSSLSLHLSFDSNCAGNNLVRASLSDHLLFVVSAYCSKLRHLRFLTGPVSLFSVLSLSESCTYLSSLDISLSRPLFVRWVMHFPCLKELSVYATSGNEELGFRMSCEDEDMDAELGLESLCLSGICAGDQGLGWLYRSCKNLKKLKLRSCGGIGDGGLISSFVNCLQGLEEVELRTCRSIVDGVLLKLAENCCSLNSLLVHDGGSRDALLHFISNCRSNLQKLDLRLPLDLKNDHLLAVAMNFRNLSSLRLQSCCLVTGEGLKALGVAMSSRLEELALISCDVVEREPGLLATLGQNLRCLKKLDLSYNELLLDKEVISMLISCRSLVELKLRGCKGLTNAAIVAMSRSRKSLENVDIMHCCGIDTEGVELFVLNSPRLRCVQVEDTKVSDVARTWASNRFIDVV